MEYSEAIRQMPRHQYDALKTALETGKWPDGKAISPEQRKHCMAAVIAFGEMHLPEDERVGYIYNPKHDHCETDGVQPLKWDK